MDAVYIVLLFLLFIAASNVLVRFIPLPLPLLQIAVGALLASAPKLGVHVSLDPELFLLLFIPPLLFSDGWHISRKAFFEEKGKILMLAMGLVFFTVLGAGYFIHWLIPVIPLTLAFALAAVLSPTDAVALGAITGRMQVPNRLMNILRGESLLNDASGLVAFKFALGAAITGVFVLRDAMVSFVFIAVVGLLVGVVLSVFVSWVRYRLIRWKGDIGSTHILLSLLLPFGSYIIAEHLGASGILAAVAAGIMMNYTTFNRDSSLTTRIQSTAVWGMIEVTFNGAIFILLGVQLPDILREAALDVAEAQANSVWTIIWYVLAITVALFVLRFVWVWVSLKLIHLCNVILRRPHQNGVTFRLILVTTMAGVRGALTLAAVLSIPLVLPNGEKFPVRDLLIFLATGAILLSLLVGSVGLPLLLKGFKFSRQSPARIEENMAHLAMANAAVAAVKDLMDSDTVRQAQDSQMRTGLCEEIIRHYERRIEMADDDESVSAHAIAASDMQKEYELLAIASERKALVELYDANKISNHTLSVLTKEADLREGAITRADIGHF